MSYESVAIDLVKGGVILVLLPAAFAFIIVALRLTIAVSTIAIKSEVVLSGQWSEAKQYLFTIPFEMSVLQPGSLSILKKMNGLSKVSFQKRRFPTFFGN